MRFLIFVFLFNLENDSLICQWYNCRFLIEFLYGFVIDFRDVVLTYIGVDVPLLDLMTGCD